MIILQVGSLDKGFQVESFNEEYMTLIMKAKSLSENVVVFGLCPRLDDSLGNIHKANDILRKIANDENLYYIESSLYYFHLKGHNYSTVDFWFHV